MHLGRLMHAAEIPTNIDVQKWGISLFFWGAAIFCDWEWLNFQLSTGYHQQAQVRVKRQENPSLKGPYSEEKEEAGIDGETTMQTGIEYGVSLVSLAKRTFLLQCGCKQI
ncbi:hypothetical protein GX48_00192 [Paracoccidioides brasiliensis]|nr:hypothetical protein GX48_00192 [Paracoccidioides brasiliensis]